MQSQVLADELLHLQALSASRSCFPRRNDRCGVKLQLLLRHIITMALR